MKTPFSLRIFVADGDPCPRSPMAQRMGGVVCGETIGLAMTGGERL